MSETNVVFLTKPKLKNPVFIEGLPGIGYIGRNAIGYLIEMIGAKKFGELHSNHFPPLVLLDPKKSGEVISLKNEFYYWKAKKKGQRDLVLLIGDSQSMDPIGHYEIANKIIETLKSLGVKEMITIGGFATGVLSEETSKVFGAGIDKKKMSEFEKLGVKFKDTNIGQIIGASGLLISIGHHKGINGVCLMGETSGMLLSDPKATEAVLDILAKYLKIKIDMTKIDEKVKEIEKIIKKIEDLQVRLTAGPKRKQSKEEIGYIG